MTTVPIIKLSEIIQELESGGRPSGGASNIGDVFSLGGEHLDDRGGFDLTSKKMISIDYFSQMKRGKIKPNDILVVKDGATTGKTSFVTDNFPVLPCAINEHVFRLAVNRSRAIPLYVFYFLFSSKGNSEILQDFRGATVGGISQEFIHKVNIPLPPMEEQRRIAAILTEKMAAVEEMRAAALAQLEELKALPAALLGQVFPPAGVALPAGWRWVRLGEVCEEDRQIIEPISSESAKRPYLGLEHIESETGIILDSFRANPTMGISTSFAFDQRHVLYGKLRPYLNKVALPDFAGRCTTELIPLLPSNIERDYLVLVLRHPRTVRFAMQGKTGSRMPRADMDELLKYEFPLPPLDEQQRIAAVLTEKMREVELARRAAGEQLAQINQLPGAYLKQAFEGGL